ncbi:MAG: 5-formyltetrahydrofolate cyclo-ligase [Paracoccaceae bacterium]
MTELDADKLAARKAAFARRKAAHHACAGNTPRATEALSQVLADHRGAPVAGYMPIRTEIDPRPAMATAALSGAVGVPVIRAAGQPLVFSRWTPDCALVDGPFGARVPAEERLIVPQVVIVPLVAFSQDGGRLGYGGGFYDRTLEGLRARGPVLAIGFAYAAQQDDGVPLEATDQPLDMIITEQGILVPKGA